MRWPRIRLFPSTWALLGLLLVGVVVLNFVERPLGWPWRMEVRPPLGSGGLSAILDEPDVLSPANIACDLLLALALVGGPAVAWEWRRRNRRSLWQFTLADVAITLALTGALLAVGRSLYNDVFCDRRLSRQLGANLSADPNRWDFLAYEYSHWVSKLHLPYEWQPYQRGSIQIQPPPPIDLNLQPGAIDLPAGAAQTIGDFRAPTRLSLEQVRLSAADWKQLSRCTSLITLNLRNNDLRDADVLSYRPAQTLDDLNIIGSEKLTDAGLATFATAPDLENLILDHLPAVHGHGLGKFQSMQLLGLSDVAVDDEGLRQIGTLKNLKQLTIYRPGKVTPESWLALAHCRQLEFLQVETPKWSDELVAMLAELPQLHNAALTGCEYVSPDAWAALATTPAQIHLEIDEGTISGASLIALNKSATLISLKATVELRVELANGELEQLTQVQQRQIALHVLQREGSGKVVAAMKQFNFGDAPWP